MAEQHSVLEYSLTIGLVAMEGRGFEYPTDLVAARDGRLYVPNRARDLGERGVRVTVTDIDSEYYGTFAHHGQGDGNMLSPMCIAENSRGHLYVTDDYTNRVSAFDYEGNFIRAWGESGDGEGQFNGPSGVAVDAQDNIYVADTNNDRVQKFTPGGQFILSFGSSGSGEGEFSMPWGVTVAPDGDLYIADWGNDRIQRFTSDCEFITAYGNSGRGDGELLRPSGVAIDERGYMYVSDWGNERLQVFDSDGKFLQKLRGEAGLSKWAANFLEINREEGEARKKSNLEPVLEVDDADDPHTQSAYIEKYFWAPMSVKLDGEGRVYVTDGNRHRIQVYRRVM
ncbi:MAG: NHL repeat-containing protein [Chloroflexi bacterium]|nr:NHL repeat-containing protein [Chloroflexota bacterium]